MEKYFYEVAINSFSNRNHIIPEEQYNSFIAKYSAAKTEFYHSVFKYTEEIKKHFDTHKTIRNYSGKFKLDFIYFDIDKAKNTDEFTLSRTKYFLKELVDDWQLYWENILIWFSGTGYHIQIHNYFGDDIEDRAVLKQTMSKYFGSTDMAIYGSSSLIRAPYSINYKSGLFKVPFEYEEFMGYNVKDIHEIASTNNVRKINKIVKNESLDWSSYIERDTRYKPASIETVDEKSTSVVCMQNILAEGDTGHNRHLKILRLAAHYGNVAGMPKNYLQMVVDNYNKTLDKKETERIVNDTLRKGYVFSCKDPILSKYCSETCRYYTKKNYGMSVINSTNHEELLLEYSKKRNNDKYRLELKYFLKTNVNVTIYSGELVVFIGDTGMGKSAFVQNIVANNTHLNWLIFPLENGHMADLRRYVQITNNMTKEEVVKNYVEGEGGLTDKIQHINFVTNSVDTDNLRKLIVQSTADIFVIDTLPAVTVVPDKNRNDAGKSPEQIVIQLLRDIANDIGKTIIVVHHISKNAAINNDGKVKALNVHSGKGSSTIEQVADKVISIEGERDGELRFIKSLKIRDGAPFSTMLKFNKEFFKFE
mgnify:CR=1 FL=1